MGHNSSKLVDLLAPRSVEYFEDQASEFDFAPADERMKLAHMVDNVRTTDIMLRAVGPKIQNGLLVSQLAEELAAARKELYTLVGELLPDIEQRKDLWHALNKTEEPTFFGE